MRRYIYIAHSTEGFRVAVISQNHHLHVLGACVLCTSTGTSKGQADGFQLDFLLKIKNTKNLNNTGTLLSVRLAAKLLSAVPYY